MNDSNHRELRRLVEKMRHYQREYFRWKSKEAQARAIQYEKKVDELLWAMKDLDSKQATNAGQQLSLLGDDEITQAVRNGGGGVL
jgi:hypothetical protein